MIAAFNFIAVKLAIAKWYATVRTEITQGENFAFIGAAEDDFLAEYGFGFQLAALHLSGRARNVPEGIKERIRHSIT